MLGVHSVAINKDMQDIKESAKKKKRTRKKFD
jgi:hypothetical protein